MEEWFAWGPTSQSLSNNAGTTVIVKQLRNNNSHCQTSLERESFLDTHLHPYALHFVLIVSEQHTKKLNNKNVKMDETDR